MPLEIRFTATASHEEQYSLPTHQPTSSCRAVESMKQRSLPSPSLSSCLSLSLAILFCLELSPFLSGATAFFPLHSRTQRRCLFVWRHALGALSESERVKSEKDELYLFLTLFLSLDGSTHLEAANVFSAWIWRERNIFDPFCRIFNMLCCLKFSCIILYSYIL